MNDPEFRPNSDQTDELRRRLTKGGLALPVVLATLASKPVLGAAPYNCTISGQLSGGSTHGQEVPCGSVGRSPGYWKHPDLHPWPQGFASGAYFNTVFADAYKYHEQNPTTFMLTNPGTAGPEYLPNPSLLQVLCSAGGMSGDDNNPALGRAAIASFLNAWDSSNQPNYPLTPQKVVDMFNAVYAGGSYEIKPGVYWNAGCVICYFESLYSDDPEKGTLDCPGCMP